MTFITRRVTTQVQSIDLAPLAAGALRGFVQEGKHQGLLDDILRAMHQTLTQPDTMAVIRDKIRAELPTLLRLYRADKFRGEQHRRPPPPHSSRRCAAIPNIRSAASSTACCCPLSTGSAATRPLPIASTASSAT